MKLNSLEARALLAQLFVRHQRPAEAEKELRAMLAADEDHPLTVLTAARVALGSGQAKKCGEAAGALDELAERSGGATALVAGLAAQCQLAAGRPEEAEAALKVPCPAQCSLCPSHGSSAGRAGARPGQRGAAVHAGHAAGAPGQDAAGRPRPLAGPRHAPGRPPARLSRRRRERL